MVHDELEALQLHANTHHKETIPIVLLISGRLLSGEIVARRHYQAALGCLPNSAQMVAIDGRSDGHVYLSSPASQQVLKIDISSVQGFGPIKQSIKPQIPVPIPQPKH